MATVMNHPSKLLRLELRIHAKTCEGLDTPRALTSYLLSKYGEWDQLVNLTIDPLHYLASQSEKFESDYLATEVLKKNVRLKTSYNLEQVTLEGFMRWEAQCAQTNEHMASYEAGNIFPLNGLSHRAISCAREIVRSILGAKPSECDLHFAEDNMRFGPGTTTSLSGDVTSQKKFSQRELHVTPRLSDFGVWCHPPGWSPRPDICLVTSSRFRQVPKNAKINRGICIEPDLNMYVQLGIGALIRRKLLRASVDLDTQQYNQFAAANAVHLGLATVDLRAASDCIARSIVWLLLPDAWSHLLWLPRVDITTLPCGKEVKLEKWSSMGNGYTFELESLLFYALAKACCAVSGDRDDYVNAYGDDIIVPSSSLTLLIDTLNFLGFDVNTEKTFGSGLFRESCGADFFDGRPVRPFYLRSENEDFTEICYLYANGIRRWAHRTCGGLGCDSRLLPSWLCIYTTVNEKDRHRIPDGLGDEGFIGNFDEATPRYRSCTGEYLFTVRRRSPLTSSKYPLGALIASLAGRLGTFTLGREAMRNRFGAAATREGATSVWPNLGPWF